MSWWTAAQIFLRIFTRDIDNFGNVKAALSAERQLSTRQRYEARSTFVGLVDDFTSPSAWFGIIGWSILGIGISLGLEYLLIDVETPIDTLIMASAVTLIIHIVEGYATILRWIFGDSVGTEPLTPVAAGRKPVSPVILALNEPLKDVTNELKELRQMAATFGSKISEGRFTAAEIQCFLLMNMESPAAALASIDPWVERMIAAKNERKNIISSKPVTGGGKLTS